LGVGCAMNLKKHRKLAAWIVAVVLLLCAVRFAGEHDFRAVVADRKPSFTLSSAYLSDGGSVEYWGVGYTVSYLHRIYGDSPTGRLYRTGPLLEYWLPVPGVLPTRDATHVYARTNK
jgi:hypothetical protein